ncbi:MAG TPA: helix-turn-helix domain-containing protein [Chitinophagaceae bacterium]|nr:helix-turn-helix domain-containing protein [Chitinophagaceae bacterium]
MQNLQAILFNKIRTVVPNPGLLVEDLVKLLEISKDSAYRRLKGEKQLSFDEMVTIAHAYDLSLDDLLDLWEESVVFQGDYVADDFDMEKYLLSMQVNLEKLLQFEQKELYYISKDLPVFYYLMFPEIAAFKFFVWTKTQMQFEVMKEKKFSFDILTPYLKDLSYHVAELYTKVPSVEILNADNILNDLRQLEYYKDTNLISGSNDLAIIYSKLHSMISHMDEQASLGRKFMPGKEQHSSNAGYKLYVNDFFVGDNTLLAKAGDLRLVYMNHAAINFVFTSTAAFVDYNEEFMNNIIRRSSLISEVGERTRTRFFNLIHERIIQFSEGIRQNSY